jgi:hypothetical protein
VEALAIFQSAAQPAGVANVIYSFARVAAARGQAERALRLAGAAVGLRTAMGHPVDPAEVAQRSRCLEPARRAVGNEKAAAAWAAGEALSVEQALSELRQAQLAWQ